jgi:hypothetical protein
MELPIVALIVSILGLAFQYFFFKVKQDEAIRKEFAVQNDRIKELEVKGNVFWKALENKLADMLKSPTHLDKDILLDKFKDGELTEEETKVLRTMLTEEFNKEKSLALALFISRLETNITMKSLSHKRSNK